MFRRISALGLAAFAFALLAGPAVANAASQTGEIKSASATKLVVTVDKKDHTFDIAKTATITLDGKKAKASDLKAGQKVTVTFTEAEEKMVASRIVATSKKE